MKLYHVTKNLEAENLFIPRVPNSRAGRENDSIGRICFSNSVCGAISAHVLSSEILHTERFISKTPTMKCFVLDTEEIHIPEKNLLGPSVLSNLNLVQDAMVTNEYWVINQKLELKESFLFSLKKRPKHEKIQMKFSIPDFIYNLAHHLDSHFDSIFDRFISKLNKYEKEYIQTLYTVGEELELNIFSENSDFISSEHSSIFTPKYYNPVVWNCGDSFISYVSELLDFYNIRDKLQIHTYQKTNQILENIVKEKRSV